MTQIALQIAKEATEKTTPCWYCDEEPDGPRKTNVEVAIPQTEDNESEDDVPENDAKNDSSKLGGNLIEAGQPRPQWQITCPDQNVPTFVLPAAHHCIPGNASLKKAMDQGLRHYMKAEGSRFNLSSDIGYGVNHANNGVWLPGNYNVRGGKEHYTQNWGAYDAQFCDEYAKRAMEKTTLQFHDAHQPYNDNVLATLLNIMEKLGEPETTCPICGKEFDKQRPPWGLVGRLDSVSGKHRSMITTLAESAKKFVEAGYVTSSRVKKLFGVG
jgi:hypothetical protein